MAKFCTHCGARIKESSKFCEYCGNQVADAATAPGAQAAAEQSQYAPPPFYGANRPEAPNQFSSEINRKHPVPRMHRKGTRVLSIALSALLLVQTTVVAMFGWPGFLIGNKAGTTGTQGGPRTGSMKNMTITEIVSGTVSEENMTLEKGGARFAISEVTFVGETNAAISKVENAPALMGFTMTAYDFSVDTDEKPAGIMELTMPCDAAEDETVLVGYLNEQSGEWEPAVFTHDRQNKEIIILADHLSSWGYTTMKTDVFHTQAVEQMKNPSEGQSLLDFSFDYKTVPAIQSGGLAASESSEDLLSTCILAGITAYDAAGQTDDYLNDLGGTVVETLNSIFTKQYTSGAPYTDSFIAGFGNAFAKVGIAMDVINAYRAQQNGDEQAYKLSMISLYGAGIGAIGVAIGAPALVAAASAISLYTVYEGLQISYSDDWRARRMEDLNQRYTAFYKKHKLYKKSSDWYRILYPIFTSNTDSNEFMQRVEKAVMDYAQAPFQLADAWKSEHPSYYNLSLEEQTLHDLASLNEAGRKRMTGDLYNQIMTEVIEPTVLPRILQQAEYEALNEWAHSKAHLGGLLSMKNTLEIRDPEKRYAGMRLRFVIPYSGQIVDPATWEAKLNEDGEAKFSFTLKEHLAIGAPVTIEIFDAQDKAVHSFTVQLDPPHTVHEIWEDAISGIRYVEGFNENRAALSIDTLFAIALREAEVIPLDKEGDFALDTYAEFFFEEGPITKPKGDGTETNTTKIEMRTQIMQMSGNWDGETGSFRFEIAVSGERSTDRTDVTPSSTKGYPDYVSFWQFRPTYEGVASGTGTIMREGDQLVFQCDGEWSYIYKEPYTLTVNNGSPQGNAFDDKVKSGKFTPAIRFDIVNGGDGT